MTENPARLNRWLRIFLKLARSTAFRVAVAVLIVYLLVRFNQVDWAALGMIGKTWPWLLGSFLLMMPPFAIVSYRLRLLLASQHFAVTYGQAVRWTMIGSLFDLIMPSSNGGDLVKAGYVVNHVGAGMRVRAVAAIAIDRILGLVGLFLLAGLVSIFNWQVIAGLRGGPFLLVASLGATAAVLVAFRVLGARRLYNNRWLNAQRDHSNWGKRAVELLRAFNELRERPRFLAGALLLSVLNHTFWCISLVCISHAVGNEVTLIEGFAVFPLAIFGNFFGVAGGFGAGTAAFAFLLSQLLGIGNGALIGLVFQTLSAFSKLAGLPFYLAAHGASPPLKVPQDPPTPLPPTERSE